MIADHPCIAYNNMPTRIKILACMRPFWSNLIRVWLLQQTAARFHFSASLSSPIESSSAASADVEADHPVS